MQLTGSNGTGCLRNITLSSLMQHSRGGGEVVWMIANFGLINSLQGLSWGSFQESFWRKHPQPYIYCSALFIKSVLASKARERA